MIRAVALDLDGTLAHRPADFRAWLDLVRADLGLLSCDFERFPSVLVEELGRDGAVTLGSAIAAALGRFGQRVGDLEPVVHRALAAYAGPIELLPGARELLDELGVPLALVTNGPADMQRAAIARLGIGGRFRRVIVSGDADVAARKPDPRPFRLACGALGHPPGDVLMAGDDAAVDVAGALAAGMRAVQVGGVDLPDLAALRAWLTG